MVFLFKLCRACRIRNSYKKYTTITRPYTSLVCAIVVCTERLVRALLRKKLPENEFSRLYAMGAHRLHTYCRRIVRV